MTLYTKHSRLVCVLGLQQSGATDVGCPRAPKCHAYNGLRYCSHAVADCISNKCWCNKAGYNPCTCAPTVGSCTITNDSNNARATATYLGESRQRFSCTPSDFNPNYNVHIISTYASNNPAMSRGGHHAGDATINIRKEGGKDKRPIIIVLVSHQPNRWTLNISEDIQLEKVVLISYYMDKTNLSFDLNESVKYIERQDKVQIGHGDDSSYGETPKLLRYVQHRFGSIASFTGSHRADTWGLTIISQGDSGRQWFKPVRLVGGDNSMEGRVEVYMENHWGTVCDDNWDLKDAIVVCRQFGYNGPSCALTGAQFGQGAGKILMDNVACVGDEQNIGRCSYDDFGQHNCKHNEDAGVVCTSGTEPTPEIAVRLVDGDVQNEGRVELFHEGAWGTVCGKYWTTVDGTVVCRQLGYFFASEVTRAVKQFGEGSGPILLDNISCDGSEDDLFECQHSNIGENEKCTHGHDAGVICATAPPDTLPVRLINGESQTEGLVQVKYFGNWLHVCGDHGWDVRDARVICHQLGYGEATLGYTPMEDGSSGYYDELFEVDRTRSLITIDRMHCFGNETNVGKCKYEVQFSQRCSFGAPLTCRTPRPGLSAAKGMTVTSPMFWVCLGIGILLLALIVFMFVCFFMRRAPPRQIERTPALSAIVTSATRASIPMVGPAASESLDSVWVPRHHLGRLDSRKYYHDSFSVKPHKRHAGKPSYLTTQYMPPRTALSRPVVPVEFTMDDDIT